MMVKILAATLFVFLTFGQACQKSVENLDGLEKIGPEATGEEESSPPGPDEFTDREDERDVHQESESGVLVVDPEFPFGFISSFYGKDRSGLNEDGSGGERPDLRNSHPHDRPYYSTAKDIGSRWERLSHPTIDWDYVQSTLYDVDKATYDWTISDNFIGDVPSDLRLVVNLFAGSNHFEKGTWTFRSGQESAYIDFIEKAVERYDGDGVDDKPGLRNFVKFWQIDNEPATRAFQRGDCSGLRCLNKEYQDAEGYAYLLKVTYSAIKRADPGATVISGGVMQGDSVDSSVYSNFWSDVLTEVGSYSQRCFDIFDVHWFSSWSKSKSQYQRYRNKLDSIGYRNVPIWMTENGSDSATKGERWQAVDHVRRFLYPMTFGVKKIFRAWALVEGWPPFSCNENSMFESTGFIYDGHCRGDKGYGAKKLGYYTYKLISNKLQKIKWSGVRLEKGSAGSVYLVKLPGDNGSLTYVAWLDTDDESKTESFSFSVSGSKATVIKMVPEGSSGSGLNPADFPKFFEKENISFSGTLNLEATFVPKLILIR